MSDTAPPQRGLLPDGSRAMTAAEFRTTRQMLGLSVRWIAAAFGVSERSVRKWDGNTNPVPEGIATGLDRIADTTADLVDAVVQRRSDEPEFVFRVPRPSGPDPEDQILGGAWAGWPVSWWWNAAGRILDADRGSRGGAVEYADPASGEGPTLPPPAVPVED